MLGLLGGEGQGYAKSEGYVGRLPGGDEQAAGWAGEEHRGLAGPWRKGARVGAGKGLPTLLPVPSFQKSTSYFRSEGGMQGGSW